MEVHEEVQVEVVMLVVVVVNIDIKGQDMVDMVDILLLII